MPSSTSTTSSPEGALYSSVIKRALRTRTQLSKKPEQDVSSREPSPLLSSGDSWENKEVSDSSVSSNPEIPRRKRPRSPLKKTSMALKKKITPIQPRMTGLFHSRPRGTSRGRGQRPSTSIETPTTSRPQTRGRPRGRPSVARDDPNTQRRNIIDWIPAGKATEGHEAHVMNEVRVDNENFPSLPANR